MPAMDFLHYYGISTCNIMEFQFATFCTFILQQTAINSTVHPSLVMDKLKNYGKNAISGNKFLTDLDEEYHWFIYLKEGIYAPKFAFKGFLEPISFLEGKLYVNPRYILADVNSVIEKINRIDFDFYSAMTEFRALIEEKYKRIY